MVTDANREILRVNRAFTHITGYTEEEVIGKHPGMLSSGRHGLDFYAEMWESINNTGTWEGEVWNRRKNGEIYPEYLTFTAVKGRDGIAVNYVATMVDITCASQRQRKFSTWRFMILSPATQPAAPHGPSQTGAGFQCTQQERRCAAVS